MRDLVFTSFIADPYIWMGSATKFEGFKYREYVIIHTDNLLVISHRADLDMKVFDQNYTLKADPKTGKK